MEDLPILGADVQVLDFQGHAVVVAFFVRVRGWTRSSSVISFSVLTIDPWTRVQRNFVGHGSWFSWCSRGADEHAVGVRGDALDRGDVALERAHDLGHA